MTLSRIILIPLDERPVNTRYPQMLGAIGGADILLPPVAMRGFKRQPADLDAVALWLRETVEFGADALAVSCDFLGYGNLINARISDDTAMQALGRLAVLEEFGATIPVYAFSLITRVSNADDNVEEPLYWSVWGTKLYAYSRLAHRIESGEILDAADREAHEHIESQVPDELKADWLKRRLRNHTVNLALIDLAARDKLQGLLLTSDDTAAFGFPTRERNWLKSWLGMIGEEAAAQIAMHPGADEVGSALVAKLINRKACKTPRVWIEYAIAPDQEVIAPYEDRPVRETVLGQTASCGCAVAASADDADFVLGVVTPVPGHRDYRPEYDAPDRAARSAPYAHFLQRLARHQGEGIPVAVADVAYPNGTDPFLAEMLLHPDSPLKPGALTAFGAWNTAGNTLGTVVAQASCALQTEGDAPRLSAQKVFLAHRFLEDYGYQQIVRREARTFAEAQWGRREPNPNSSSEQATICAFIEERLAAILTELQAVGIGQGITLIAGSVALPWRRTFEVDFELA